MPVFIIREGTRRAEPPRLEGALQTKISDLKEVGSLDAFLSSAATPEPNVRSVAIVALSPNDRDHFERVVGFATRHGERTFLVLIGDEISATDYKRLVRTGGADWVSINAAPEEVIELIASKRIVRDTSASRASDRRPVTISFVPSAGGVGNTTLLLQTAGHVKTAKATGNLRICIVDLDFQTSHVCDYLDSEARLHIAELSSAPERLDEQLFESFKTRHQSGLDVFASPRSKFASDALDIHGLDALLSMIATRYDLVLLDCPVPWFSWTSQIIGVCDGAVITGINTIPCLRQIGETLSVVRSNAAPLMPVGIAINRCERTLLGSISRRKHAQMALRGERLFFIGNRTEAVDSVNMGVPMILGPSAASCRREFASLAEFCAGMIESRIGSG